MKVGYSFEGLVNRVTAVDESAVHKTGDETIAGLKTFSTCPATTGVQGTANTHLTRRDFVVAELDKKVNLTGNSTITGNVTVTGTLKGILYHSSGYFNFANFNSLYGDGRLQGYFREHDSGTETGFLGFLLEHRDATGAATGKQIDIVMNGNYVYHTGRPPSATAVGAYSKAESDARYVNLTGAQTIGGAKTFSSNLTAPAFLSSAVQNTAVNATTRKDYVDAEIAKQVAKTGDTMTGPLVVNTSSNYPVMLKSTTVGVVTPQYLTGVDSAGNQRWYVGQGSGNSADVLLYSAGHAAYVRVEEDKVSFSKDPVSLAVQGTAAGSLVRRDYLQEETVGQTPQRAVPIPGSMNLNTFLSPGIWYQDSNANAISGSNYPTLQAGVLTVEKTAGVIQTYKVYNSSLTFTRAYYNSVWTPWVSNFNANYPPNPTQVGAVSLVGNDLKSGQLIVQHSTLPLVMRSTTPGLENSSYLLSQTSSGVSRWYVGQANAGNEEVVLHNYSVNTNIRLSADAVIANRALQDNTGTTFTTGRLPTAAQGNSNVVQGQHSVVGTYIFATLKPTAGSTANPGTNVSGVNLHPCGAAAYTENRAWVLAGTWMCMGAFNAPNSDDSWDDRATLWFRVA